MDISMYTLAIFTLDEAHTSAGINIKDALLQNIMIMATHCIFYFYSHIS